MSFEEKPKYLILFPVTMILGPLCVVWTVSRRELRIGENEMVWFLFGFSLMAILLLVICKDDFLKGIEASIDAGTKFPLRAIIASTFMLSYFAWFTASVSVCWAYFGESFLSTNGGGHSISNWGLYTVDTLVRCCVLDFAETYKVRISSFEHQPNVFAATYIFLGRVFGSVFSFLELKSVLSNKHSHPTSGI